MIWYFHIFLDSKSWINSNFHPLSRGSGNQWNEWINDNSHIFFSFVAVLNGRCCTGTRTRTSRRPSRSRSCWARPSRPMSATWNRKSATNSECTPSPTAGKAPSPLPPGSSKWVNFYFWKNIFDPFFVDERFWGFLHFFFFLFSICFIFPGRPDDFRWALSNTSINHHWRLYWNWATNGWSPYSVGFMFLFLFRCFIRPFYLGVYILAGGMEACPETFEIHASNSSVTLRAETCAKNSNLWWLKWQQKFNGFFFFSTVVVSAKLVLLYFASLLCSYD